MAKGKENKNRGAPDLPKACKMEGCREKPKKFGFCMEHFDMYMFGVVRGDGKKPVDYEYKLNLFLKEKSHAKEAS